MFTSRCKSDSPNYISSSNVSRILIYYVLLFSDPNNLSSPLTDTGRKDSLSLNVEFVKVNISRSRKGIFQGEASTSQSSAKLSSLAEGQTKAANIVRFSGT